MQRKTAFLAAVVLVLALQACGGSGSSSSFLPTGSVDVSLTDGPGEYDHVYITVRDIWFHSQADAGPAMKGWLRFPLSEPVTVDLLSLSNGVVGSAVWKDLALPSGTYHQIRIVLAGTEDALTTSASDQAIQYNNEVMIGSTEYPLRVPSARLGIMLTGDFEINPAGKLKLAVDFDAGHDIVDIERNGSTEYVLKPRLAYFDLDNAGAIVGSMDAVSAATNSSSRFVVKAEQVDDPQNPQHHVVRRWTIVKNGNFTLYPLRPGNYDIVIRGLGHQTVIVRNVPVVKGTTPANAPTVIPEIAMSAGTDYPVDGSIVFPTGSWVNFYQTLPGTGEVPYEIRFRHFNPVIGRFFGFRLSHDALRVGDYDNSIISLSTITPVEDAGGFRAAAGAILYSRATFSVNGSDIVTSGTTTVAFGALSPIPQVSANTISGMITRPTGSPGELLDRGILFIAHGGMIVHATPIDNQMQMMSGASYTVAGLPGGSPSKPLPLAFYGIDALAWSNSEAARAFAVPAVADLRMGDDAGVDMHMLMLP